MTAKKQANATPKYVMKISRLTVDKLGVKLYDRVSAVIKSTEVMLQKG